MKFYEVLHHSKAPLKTDLMVLLNQFQSFRHKSVNKTQSDTIFVLTEIMKYYKIPDYPRNTRKTY